MCCACAPCQVCPAVPPCERPAFTPLAWLLCTLANQHILARLNPYCRSSPSRTATCRSTCGGASWTFLPPSEQACNRVALCVCCCSIVFFCCWPRAQHAPLRRQVSRLAVTFDSCACSSVKRGSIVAFDRSKARQGRRQACSELMSRQLGHVCVHPQLLAGGCHRCTRGMLFLQSNPRT